MVRESLGAATYKFVMTVTWLDRITAAIGLSGLSYREASSQAGLGINYISQMMKKADAPDGARLAKICAVVDVPQEWVIAGHPPNPLLDPIVNAATGLPTEKRRQFFSLLDKAESVAISQVDALSKDTPVSSNELMDLLRLIGNARSQQIENTSDLEVSPEGKPLDSNVDAQLFAEAYDLVLAHEETEGVSGSRDARLRLTKRIYDKLISIRSGE